MKINFKGLVISEKITSYQNDKGEEIQKRYLGIMGSNDDKPIRVLVPLNSDYKKLKEYEFVAEFSTYFFNGKNGFSIKAIN